MKRDRLVYEKKIYYENESIDVTKQSLKYLVLHDFQQNDLFTNICLLEKSLIDYSIRKLADWNVNIKGIDIKKLEDLETICTMINFYISTNPQRYEYFIQYVHCITYMLGIMMKQPQISLNKINSSDKEVQLIENGGQIITIDINQNVPSFLLPSKLIGKIKEHFQEKEKNPVLKK